MNQRKCESHNFVEQDKQLGHNEKRIFLVVLLTLVTMVAEVFYGYITGSMALLADGWHMGSHVGALSITLIAYRFSRSKVLQSKLNFGAGKVIPLGGYTSALLLGMVALLMIGESVHRFFEPNTIGFDTAILVSVIGLVVNVLSAFLLGHGHSHPGGEHVHHHTEEVHDHNHQSALMHVIADALTSVLAISALVLGKYLQWYWADPAMGVVGAIVILKWAYGLCGVTAVELLDGMPEGLTAEQLQQFMQSQFEVKVIDVHIWRVAPSAHACELVIATPLLRGGDYYRESIFKEFRGIQHLVIEESHVLD